MHLLLAALLAAASQQQPAFDTTVAVAANTRLEAFASAGTIDVRVWDRAAVRVVARPRRGSVVQVRSAGVVLSVTARTPSGGIDLVDYEITAPRRMDLTLGRGDVDITVHGSEGAVDARNTAGTITVDGGRRTIALQSLEGAIVLRGARGRVQAKSTNAPVTLSDVVGDVDAESTGSHVTLTNVDTRDLRAASVHGVVRFSGPLHADGRYVLTSHSGSVWVRAPAPVNATVSVATVSGGFSTHLPYQVTDRQRRGIFTARFGSGSAQVTMESFSGGIVIEELARDERRE